MIEPFRTFAPQVVAAAIQQSGASPLAAGFDGELGLNWIGVTKSGKLYDLTHGHYKLTLLQMRDKRKSLPRVYRASDRSSRSLRTRLAEWDDLETRRSCTH